MKTLFRVQRRRKGQPHDGSFFRKENNKEQSFFSDTGSESFFQPAAVQRKCDKCEEDEKKPEIKKKEEDDKGIQAKEAKGSVNTSIAGTGSSFISNLSGGAALSCNVNNFFSSRLGRDFGDVKIHTGGEAEKSAKLLNAQAYTYGNHIVFADGKYNPETEEGKRLLAHELTHVIQQQGIQRKIQRSPAEEGGGESENTNEIIDESPEKEQEAEDNEQVSSEPVSLPSFTVFGQPDSDTVFANSVRFTGETKADFDGGIGQTRDLKAIPAKKCSGCTESDCVTVTGTLDVTYTVTTSVMLPDVPEGLTPCQHHVKDAIDNKIAPHEQKHVEAYEKYNGTKSIPISYTGCKEGIQAYVQKLTDTDSFARKAAVKAKSKALDPFFVNVDLNCKEPEPPKEK